MRKSSKPAQDPNRYPSGLNYQKVQDILRHYDKRKDVDVLSDVETRQHAADSAWIEVPQKILPEVQKLIVKHRKSA